MTRDYYTNPTEIPLRSWWPLCTHLYGSIAIIYIVITAIIDYFPTLVIFPIWFISILTIVGVSSVVVACFGFFIWMPIDFYISCREGEC